jgi:hypothetical protein
MPGAQARAGIYAPALFSLSLQVKLKNLLVGGKSPILQKERCVARFEFEILMRLK